MIYTLIKKTNINLLLLNIVLLIIFIILVCIIYPFTYNVLCGPFEITDEEIMNFAEQNYNTDYPKWENSTKEFDKVVIPEKIFDMPYYKRGNQFYFKFDFDVNDETDYAYLLMYRPVDLIKTRSKTFCMGNISEKWMYILYYDLYADASDGAVLTAANPKFLSELCSKTTHYTENRTGEILDLFDRHIDYSNVINVMIHVGDNWIIYTWCGIIFLSLYAILLIFVIRKSILRFADIKNHPVFKQNIDFEELSRELDEGYEKKKNVYTTENWIIEKKVFNLYVAKRSNLIKN